MVSMSFSVARKCCYEKSHELNLPRNLLALQFGRAAAVHVKLLTKICSEHSCEMNCTGQR